MLMYHHTHIIIYILCIYYSKDGPWNQMFVSSLYSHALSLIPWMDSHFEISWYLLCKSYPKMLKLDDAFFWGYDWENVILKMEIIYRDMGLLLSANFSTELLKSKLGGRDKHVFTPLGARWAHIWVNYAQLAPEGVKSCLSRPPTPTIEHCSFDRSEKMWKLLVHHCLCSIAEAIF